MFAVVPIYHYKTTTAPALANIISFELTVLVTQKPALFTAVLKAE